MSDAAEVISRSISFWEKAYQENFNALCSHARCRLTRGSLADAEDAVSEAFFRAMRYVREPEAIENVFGYLWRTVTHVWITKQRADKTAITDSLDSPGNEGLENRLPAIDMEREILGNLENERFRNEFRVKKGPLTEREDFLLTRHLEGCSCAEIALELNEDARITRADLNAVKAKVRYRITKGKAKTTASG